jgi:hypothetical protein
MSGIGFDVDAGPEDVWKGHAAVNVDGVRLAVDMLDELGDITTANDGSGIVVADYSSLEDCAPGTAVSKRRGRVLGPRSYGWTGGRGRILRRAVGHQITHSGVYLMR